MQEALDLLVKMEMKGSSPNDVTYNVLISGLCKDGKLDKAKQLMQEM